MNKKQLSTTILIASIVSIIISMLTFTLMPRGGIMQSPEVSVNPDIKCIADVCGPIADECSQLQNEADNIRRECDDIPEMIDTICKFTGTGVGGLEVYNRNCFKPNPAYTACIAKWHAALDNVENCMARYTKCVSDGVAKLLNCPEEQPSN